MRLRLHDWRKPIEIFTPRNPTRCFLEGVSWQQTSLSATKPARER